MTGCTNRGLERAVHTIRIDSWKVITLIPLAIHDINNKEHNFRPEGLGTITTQFNRPYCWRELLLTGVWGWSTREIESDHLISSSHSGTTPTRNDWKIKSVSFTKSIHKVIFMLGKMGHILVHYQWTIPITKTIGRARKSSLKIVKMQKFVYEML